MIERYRLGPVIGGGNRSVVYRGTETATGQTFALKVLTCADPREIIRNRHGFRRMKSVQSPHVAAAHQIHIHDGYTILVMREIVGSTLTDYVAELSRRPATDAFAALERLVRHYAAALDAMHTRGLVHRDVKPDNLMVGADGKGVVIDFGLVGTVDPFVDPHGYRHYIAGSPFYNAPEVMFRQFHLPASDIFSLGLVLIEVLGLVTGGGLLRRDATSESDDRVRVHQALRGLHGDVPDALVEACEDMVQADPSERPTAARLAHLGKPIPTSTATASKKTPPPIQPKMRDEIDAWIDHICHGKSGRLHIYGDIDTGKSATLADVLRSRSTQRWLQIYAVQGDPTIAPTELHTVRQMIDAVATRYCYHDLDPLECPGLVYELLIQEFPILRPVLRRQQSCLWPSQVTGPVDLADAVLRMTREMQKSGPVIFLVDQFDHVDTASRQVLDRLTRDGTRPHSGFGIITVGRRDGSPPNSPNSANPSDLSNSSTPPPPAMRRLHFRTGGDDPTCDDSGVPG